jgi:hypothetical protein
MEESQKPIFISRSKEQGAERKPTMGTFILAH